jgi:hypothetical protein
VKVFFVVLIVHLNVSIENCILHDLVHIVVKDRKCVLLVVALKRNYKTKYAIRNALVHKGNEEKTIHGENIYPEVV